MLVDRGTQHLALRPVRSSEILDRMDRTRVAAVIVRDGSLLMVRERGAGPEGRHDGAEYWTLPGGGVAGDEDLDAALFREVREEVGLTVLSSTFLQVVPYPTGLTSCFWTDVADGEPILGTDQLTCDCPRMVGLQWVPLQLLPSETGGFPIPLVLFCW